MAATLARRKAAREPRVVLTDRGGHPRTLDPDDPAAEALVEAAEGLISAAQRRSGGLIEPPEFSANCGYIGRTWL